MTPKRTTYRVWQEHTLVYRKPGDAFYGILAADVWSGGNPDPLRGVLALGGATEDLRPATLADFARFRVDPKGYEVTE